MENWKVEIILLKLGSIKTTLLFPERYNHTKFEVELYLANYTNKSELKDAAGVGTSQFAKENVFS